MEAIEQDSRNRAEGKDLRRDVDTDRWEGERSKWARRFPLQGLCSVE